MAFSRGVKMVMQSFEQNWKSFKLMFVLKLVASKSDYPETAVLPRFLSQGEINII